MSKRSGSKEILLIRPDGRVEAVYSDLLPALGLGRLRVERASSVEWDAGRQRWVARLLATGEEIAVARERARVLRREREVLTHRPPLDTSETLR